MKVAAGVQIGPYQVVEQVGRGGMATVFKAYQPALERNVAIKVLPEFLADDPQSRERFRREAVAVAKLRHPGILAVFDHGEFEGQPYIVTEFVEGGTFADELGKPIALGRALDVLGSVASALDYAHQSGILHRDVKPSNILIGKNGNAVLGDFGLARMMATNERLTRLDMVVGTPEYMSPEQCAGRETGPASDQYSLGVVAFEALTGHVPYHAETPAAVMLAQIQSPLPAARSVNPSVPAAVETALERALAKEAADRFSDCSSFVKALETLSSEQAVAAATIAAPAGRPKASPVPRSVPDRRNLWLLAGAAALVALLALAGVLYAASRGPSQTNQTGLAHGSLIYDASLDKKAWSSGGEPSPDPAGSATVAYGKSIDIHIAQDGAGLSGEFDGPSLKNYVSELVLSVDPGSDFEINWRVRGSGPNEAAEVGLNIQVSEESMTLYLSPNAGNNQALTAAIPLPGIQGGRIIHFGMLVNGPNISLYLDGKRVADVHETSSTGATTPAFDMDGKSGTLHIVSLRYYAVA